jgi:hypothetical protein
MKKEKLTTNRLAEFSKMADIPTLSQVFEQSSRTKINSFINLYNKNVFQMFTEGMQAIYKTNAKGATGIDGRKYEYRIKGMPSRNTTFAITIDQTNYNIGRNFQPFKICVREPIFFENDIIALENEQQLFVRTNHVQLSPGKFEYSVQIHGNKADEYLRQSNVVVDRKVGLVMNAQPEYSRKGYLSMRDNSETRVNYLNKIRVGATYTSEAAREKWLVYDDSSGTPKPISLVTKLEDDLLQSFYQQRETAQIFSRSNVDPNTGQCLGVNAYGEPYITGDGIYHAIRKDGINENYTILTEGVMQNLIANVQQRNPTVGFEQIKLVIMTGSRGMIEASNFMQRIMGKFTMTEQGYVSIDGKRKVTIGAQFHKYIWCGAEISFVYNYVFDLKDALPAPLDPMGYPQTSSMFLMLDMSVYDGVPNIVSLTQNGCAMITNKVPGFGGMNGTTSGISASREEGSAVDIIGVCGAVIHIPETCAILTKLWV